MWLFVVAVDCRVWPGSWQPYRFACHFANTVCSLIATFDCFQVADLSHTPCRHACILTGHTPGTARLLKNASGSLSLVKGRSYLSQTFADVNLLHE